MNRRSGYADDFFITGDSKQVLEEEVMPIVAGFLGERGLKLSAEKTVVTHIDCGFDFLGQNVRKYKGKLLIKPAKERTLSFLREIREVIRRSGSLSVGELIALLSPKIRGWANYHRHVVSKQTFGSVDYQIWKALWRWAKRRHPNKGARWVLRRYFPTRHDRHWVPTGEIVRSQKEKRVVWWPQASSVAIVRHPALKLAANPFDPNWQAYFQARAQAARTPFPRTSMAAPSGCTGGMKA